MGVLQGSRAKKSNAALDPLNLLLCHILSIGAGCTRALTGAERWLKDNYSDEVKPDFEDRCGDGGRCRIGASAAFTRTQFNALPPEEQKKYEQLVKDKRERALANIGKILPPEAVQK